MKKHSALLVTLTAALMLSACAGSPPVKIVEPNKTTLSSDNAPLSKPATEVPEKAVTTLVEPPNINRVNDDSGLGQKLLVIHFEFNKDDVSPQDAKAMQEFVKVLKANRSTFEKGKLSIQGHTDVRGSDAINSALSGRRAAAALAYLKSIDAPLASIDIETIGMGSKYPTNQAATEQAYAENRRAEIRLTAKNDQ